MRSGLLVSKSLTGRQGKRTRLDILRDEVKKNRFMNGLIKGEELKGVGIDWTSYDVIHVRT